jgi:phenylalanyl-tRNA synthetase beta subunit
MVTMFSEYCAEPFKIEPVEVEYYSGKKEITPSLKYWEESVDPEYIRRQIGLPQDVTAETMAKLLSRMGLVSRNVYESSFLEFGQLFMALILTKKNFDFIFFRKYWPKNYIRKKYAIFKNL